MKNFLTLIFVVISLACHGAGLTVASTNGAAINLNLYGPTITHGSLTLGTSNLYEFVGDSLTASSSIPTYFTKTEFYKQRPGLVYNDAASGYTLSNLWVNFPTNVARFIPGYTNYVSIWILNNDIYNENNTNYTGMFNDLTNYWNAWRTNGYQVAAWTITGRATGNASQESTRSLVNAKIRESGGLYDFLIDADAMFPNASDTNYYNLDGVHMLSGTYQRVARSLSAALYGSTTFPITQVAGTAWNNVMTNLSNKNGQDLASLSNTIIIFGGLTEMRAGGLVGLVVNNSGASATSVNMSQLSVVSSSGQIATGSAANDTVIAAKSGYAIDFGVTSTVGGARNVQLVLRADGVLQGTFSGNGSGLTVIPSSSIVGGISSPFPTNHIAPFLFQLGTQWGTTNLFIQCVVTNQ